MSNGDCDLAGVVAIGASAGGVEALTQLAEGLSADLPYAFLVTLHLSPAAPSVLASIVGRRGPLPAVAAEHGTEVKPAHIYLAIPDHHLLVGDHRVVLSRGPTENGHRPAINALFRSAALVFGPRAIGVLLSGVLDDGVQGLETIRARGGVTIGQTPDDALFPAMPTNAAAAGILDYQVSAAGVGPLLKELARREITSRGAAPDETLELENRIAMAPQFATEFDTERLGPASGYTCPDCNGSLTALGHNNFRCRVGHAWSPESLLTARDDEFEAALWVALRSLREKAGLARKLADRTGHGLMAERYRHNAEEAERSLAVLSERLGLSGRPHDADG
ncbi:chemotaxis protein CheB [Mycobacterium camsae]|uniref:chemotaxis protein CheB n=1 Tax=Mycobacterium gordonae TaxID=1778 RepID=UPI00197EB7BC|nr:chemotaxis protein CheB [Mycobacterium gordonae]